MPLYAQHGHGKSDKLQEAIENKSLDGVIFAARNEQPDNLKAVVSELRGATKNITLMVDPQFYLSTFVPPRDRYLPKYPYYKAGRLKADFVGMKRLQEYSKSTLDFQMVLGVDRLISPSVYVGSFEDRWFQIALSLADASINYHASLNKAPPLLLTFLIDEHAFASGQLVDDFLDQVTTWDVYGIYLIVARNESTYSQRFDAVHFANLLYAAHVLGRINELEVVVGYTDFCGLLLRAAGVRAIGTGWLQSARRFHRGSFIQKERGGRPARLRYASGPLLNSVLLSELEQISDIGELESVLSGVSLDSEISEAASPESSGWNQRLSELQHWQTLAKLDGEFSGKEKADVKKMDAAILLASTLYVRLQEEGVVFDRNTGGDHLQEWSDSLKVFCERAEL